MNKSALKENKTLKGIAWLSLSTIILKFIGLIFKIPISYLIGDEGMGYFNSAYTVYTLFYIICSSGIPKGISIIVSKYEAESNKSADSFYKSALFILGVFGGISSVFFFLVAPFFTVLIGSSKALFSMYAVAPSVLFVCMSGVARGYLTGKMKFHHIAISEIIVGISKLFIGLTFAIIGIKLSLDTPLICALSILGITVGTCLSTIYLVYICSVDTHGASIRIERSEIHSLLKISLPITFASVGTGLSGVLDLFLIIRGLSSSGYSEGVANTLYGNYSTLTVPMVSLVSTLIAPVITTYIPVLTKYFAKGQMKNYTDNVNDSLSLVSFLTVPCFIVFMIFPSRLLGIIFESGSVTLGFMLLSVISPSIILLGLTAVINNALESTGRVHIPVLSISAGALAKIIFTWLMIRYTSFGILCAPLGTIISYTVSFVISYFGFMILTGKRVKIIKANFIPICSAAISLSITTICGVLISSMKENRIKSIIILSAFSFIYLVFMLILSKKIRNFILKIHKINKKV